MAQIRHQNKKDWISQVKEDLKKIELGENLENIKVMKTSKLKKLVNKLIQWCL